MPLEHERHDRAPRRVVEAWGFGLVAGSRWVSGSLRAGTRGALGRSLGRRCATQLPSPTPTTAAARRCRARPLNSAPPLAAPGEARVPAAPRDARSASPCRRARCSAQNRGAGSSAAGSPSKRKKSELRQKFSPQSAFSPAGAPRPEVVSERDRAADFPAPARGRNAARGGAEVAGVGGNRR